MDDNNRGHIYKLSNHGEGEQELSFVKRSPKSEEDKTLETVREGTTIEAVIEALMDRLQFLENQVTSPYNLRAMQSLTDARTALEERTADRVKREVEGTKEV